MKFLRVLKLYMLPCTTGGNLGSKGRRSNQDWISSKPLKAYSITVSVRAPRATQLVATTW